MATLKALAVTGDAAPTSNAAAAGPTDLVRKQEVDQAVAGLIGHAPVTVEDTYSIHLELPSGSQLLHGNLRRKTTSLAVNQGLLGEDPNGVFVVLGTGANQAAKGTDIVDLQTAVAGKAAAVHGHAIADVSGLQLALDGKAAANHTHANATTTVDGFMSAADKTKLDGLSSGGGFGALKYAQTFGDGSQTQFSITHNFGSEDVVVQVRKATAPKDVVECDIRVVDSNNVLLSFVTAPASGSRRVTILG